MDKHFHLPKSKLILRHTSGIHPTHFKQTPRTRMRNSLKRVKHSYSSSFSVHPAGHFVNKCFRAWLFSFRDDRKAVRPKEGKYYTSEGRKCVCAVNVNYLQHIYTLQIKREKTLSNSRICVKLCVSVRIIIKSKMRRYFNWNVVHFLIHFKQTDVHV